MAIGRSGVEVMMMTSRYRQLSVHGVSLNGATAFSTTFMRLGRARNIIFQHRCVLSHVPRTRTQWIDRLERVLIMCFSKLEAGRMIFYLWHVKPRCSLRAENNLVIVLT